ncbi:MAG: TIGR03619 family F420-dependent LLM class oxidoreductase [Mycobacterium sp.]
MKRATGVTVLPLRHPLITAKQLATLDALSGGRLILGVGVGWLEEEFAALDVPFAGRGRRHDEYLEAIQRVWATDDASVDHSTVTFDGVISRPKPTTSHVPIVISGSSTAAARRAARIVDGFFPGSGNAEDLRAILAVLTEECITQNRDPADIEVTVYAGAGTPDQLSTTIEAMLDAGAHRILLTNEPEAQLRALVETLHTRFGR